MRSIEIEFLSFVCRYLSRRRRIEIAHSLALTERQIKVNLCFNSFHYLHFLLCRSGSKIGKTHFSTSSFDGIFLCSRMKWKKDNKLQSLNDISKNEDKATSLTGKREKTETRRPTASTKNHNRRSSSSSSSSIPNSFN